MRNVRAINCKRISNMNPKVDFGVKNALDIVVLLN